MKNKDRIINECVYSALQKISESDKSLLLKILKEKYGIEPHEIAENFVLFHSVIDELLGSAHFALEREIIRRMHSSSGKEYLRNDEIQAFIEITEVFIQADRNKLAKAQNNNKKLKKIIEEEKKKLQESQRLATIGTTAGMVGHDIRNPLQAITSDAYLAKSELASLPDSEEKKNILESLDGIEKNVEYINKIVQDLQDYSRRLLPVLHSVDIEELLEGLLFNSSVPENVKSSLQVNKDIRIIWTDSALLKRILTNLVNNSIQAMTNGGKLEVNVYRTNCSCKIEIKDSGDGIPDEVKPKIFTPLFTTKSKGQGFGLATAKRLTEALGGTIDFESIKGKGTKFIIEIPQKSKKLS